MWEGCDRLSDRAPRLYASVAIEYGNVTGDLANEEGGISMVFLLAIDCVAELPAEDVVVKYEHEVVYVLFCLEDRVGKLELFALVGVGDRDTVCVAVAFDGLFFLVADDDDEFGRADVRRLSKTSSMSGLPFTSTRTLGLSSVSGRRRVPFPAARTTACMSRMVLAA